MTEHQAVKASFYRSSSFKMAILFAVLLTSAIIALIYLIINSSDESLSRSWILRVSIIMITFVSFFSFVIAVYVVRRINIIANTAQKIMETGNLNARIPVDYDWDDLSKLSVILNEMLFEIDNSVKNISQVTNNIAHDLRTPLTRLRNQIEQMTGDEQVMTQKQQLIEETDRLLSMFNGLLRIAKTEAVKLKENFSDVSLSELIRDACELYEPLAEDKNIRFSLKLTDISCFADRDLLFQAVTNLLDNAIKFSRDNGSITITTIEKQHEATICVSDNGIGLNKSEFDQVTRRFYQVDKSRTHDDNANKGHGLGLAMVEAVARLHGGKVEFADATEVTGEKGLSVFFTLKKSAEN